MLVAVQNPKSSVIKHFILWSFAPGTQYVDSECWKVAL
jgi:hypothetical protein